MAVFTSGNGDGDVYNWGQETWEEIHDADAGFNARYSGIVTYVSGSYYPETEEYSISRAFLPFDTSSIPNNAQVMSASLSFWTYDWINNNDNDGNDFITLVQTTQYSPNSLNIEDYDECGFVDNPIEGSERIDISTLSENIKYKIDLNTEGVSWVDKQGWTLLGMREGHDVLDIVPIDRSFLNIQTSQSENPPELIVTYIWDPTVTQCSDGIDNDNDGAIDYPNDFSCDSLEDEDETNPMAQCQDGIDNDNDGFVDLADPSCDSLQDDMEFPIDGWWDCGNGVLDEGEECDDGNNVYGDGCSFTCHLEDDILWDNFEPPNGEINPPITLPDEWRAPYVMSSENTAQAEGWSADDMILDECVIVEQVDWIGWRTLHVAANYPFVEVVILDNDFETVYEFTDLFYENTTFPWGGHFDGYDNVVYEGRVSLDDVVLPAGHYYVGTRLFSSLPGRNYAAVSANETENLQGNTMGIFKSDFFNYPGKPDWVFTEQLNNNPIYDYAFRVRGAVHPDQSSSECGGGPLAIGKETSTEIRLSPEEREAGIVEKIINWIKGLF
ncbi:MAG: hypothetical protein KJ718_00680 [Nanoarchaeota archaeon]|nr:hypothetical protein [Nanoarchaeota archaeon]